MLILIISIISLLISRKLSIKSSFNYIRLIIIIILVYTILYNNIIIDKVLLTYSIIKVSISINILNNILTYAVIVVSFAVHIYSLEYIRLDINKVWFIMLLGIFTLSIIILALSNNIIQLFIGWEFIGVASYLLIGFWSTRISANKSAIKAFVLNRIGDISLIVLISIIYNNNKDISFDNMIVYSKWSIIILLLSSIVKSSQVMLHNWLPTSIEGPTPVSALIHAATLVTAGVYLLVKINMLINYGYWWIGIVGSITALIAGIIASQQSDIKRLIAYSTISQLGYIFVSISMINQSITLSHLINHAFFKALLFLCAGTLIHSGLDNQDLRKYMSRVNMPITYVILLFGSISLIALPSLTGYYSKESIIIYTITNQSIYGLTIYISLLISAMLTGYYSISMLLKLNMANGKWVNQHEISYKDTLAIIVLYISAIIVGYIISDILMINTIDYHYISYTIIPLLITLIGSIISYKWSYLMNGIYFDELWSKLSISLLKYNKLIMNKLDKGIFEWLGPEGMSSYRYNVNTTINVSYYVIIIIVSILILYININYLLLLLLSL